MRDDPLGLRPSQGEGYGSAVSILGIGVSHQCRIFPDFGDSIAMEHFQNGLIQLLYDDFSKALNGTIDALDGFMKHPPIIEIHQQIYFLRGHRVMLDSDLAILYGVETKALTRAVRRNSDRFPVDFMFDLTAGEVETLRCQIGASKQEGRGGRRYLPLVFTEQGVAMLSSVLRSKQAIHVNVEIMRAFVRVRQLMEGNSNLTKKIAELEKKYDSQFKAVFDAIRQMIRPSLSENRRKIGLRG